MNCIGKDGQAAAFCAFDGFWLLSQQFFGFERSGKLVVKAMDGN